MKITVAILGAVAVLLATSFVPLFKIKTQQCWASSLDGMPSCGIREEQVNFWKWKEGVRLRSLNYDPDMYAPKDVIF